MIDACESRMRQAETFAWAVPALALTSQALLFNVVFSSSATYGGRVLAPIAGVIILLAALQFLGKHSFNFDVYEATIEHERDKIEIGLPGVSMKLLRAELVANREALPDTGFRRREWVCEDPDRTKGRLEWIHEGFVPLRRGLIVNIRAIRIWAWALTLLAVLDFALFAYALMD